MGETCYINELKPCPFCGGEAIVHQKSGRYSVGCKKNECYGYYYYSRQYNYANRAADAWNMRAGGGNA